MRLSDIGPQGVGEGIADNEDQGEYDNEGGMAIGQLGTIEDAAAELSSILAADDNLPEWVQSKITKAVDYIDTARDYMKSKEGVAEGSSTDFAGRPVNQELVNRQEKYWNQVAKEKKDKEKAALKAAQSGYEKTPQGKAEKYWSKKGVAEGLPQTLRKVVPGYAKREIDKKMDAGKFGKTDADKDANFQRYKKIQDKLKESEQVFKVIAVDKSNYLGGKEEMTVKADSIEDLFSRLSANDWYPLEINGVEVIAGKRLKQGVGEGMMDNPGQEDSPVAQAIIRRILMQRTDLLAKHGPEKVGAAVDEVADFVGDVDEIGSSDVSGWVRHVEQMLGNMSEQVEYRSALGEAVAKDIKKYSKINEKMSDMEKTAVRSVVKAKHGKDKPTTSDVKKTIKFVKNKEGIAEAGGEKQYNAFKREWRAKHGSDAKVPGYDSKEYTSYCYRQNDKKQGVEEGAKVDRMVKHIAKSERESGKSKDEAEDIAWATANKRGYLDNKNKKKAK